MALDKVTTAVITDDSVTGAKIENNPTVAGNLTVAGTSTLTGNATASGNLTVTGDIVPSTPLSHRNMIINGSMQVSQRGTSATGKTTNGYYVPDRFQIRITNNGTWTISKNTILTTEGNRHTVKLQCTTAGSSGDTGRNLAIWYSFEGADVQVLQKGTANAKKLTLSFWIRAYEAGTYRVNLHDTDNDRLVGGTYTISASNTWEKKTVTFAADTTGGNLNDDFNESLRVQWWFDSGSAYTGGTAPTAWEARASTDENAGGHTSGDDSTNNFFELTGVQLELGENATPFEWRSYGEDLARCHRYYEELNSNAASYAYEILGSGVVIDAGAPQGILFYSTKRTQPTLAFKGSVGNYGCIGSANQTLTGLTFSHPEVNRCQWSSSSGTNSTVGHGVLLRMNNSATSGITISAEL